MRRLMSYLPENYLDSKETVAFQEALQPELDLLWKSREDLLAQLDPATADWGLDYWEDALGLANGRGVELDARRRAVAAKLQGRATTTIDVVKTVAETLLGVPVNVIEVFGEYRVELEVDSNGYLPAGTDALKRRLREIMPAHLDWALVIPTWLPIPIRAALGPRTGRTEPPRYRAQLPAGKLYSAAVMGVFSSTVTLPMAAEGRRDGRSAEPNDVPMRAYHEEEVNY